MARLTLPAKIWVDIKASLGLSDDKFYTTSNEGSSLIQVVTNQVTGTSPSSTNVANNGVCQKDSGIESWLDHSSGAGFGIWMYSHDKDGQIEVTA